ncbi:hypothetical protein, partial [Burkholderia sp. SIMBA_024]|uniref:hypothetical protein n=1 Tax=Burkholderia sp. SIMBA_024 TaxID=3085768 RepID=UPI0039791700
LITSSAAAEAAGLNSFRTGTLELEDIENYSRTKGSSFGVSGGYGKNGSGAQGEHAAAQGSPDGKPGGATGGKSVGFGTTS